MTDELARMMKSQPLKELGVGEKGMYILGSRNNECKDPKSGMSLVYLRN